MDYETIMVNCNPETVSTDHDTSDRLYFEPVTLEDVLEIVAIEKTIGCHCAVRRTNSGLSSRKIWKKTGVRIVGTTP
jgi:carbamoyl-phosphate synthase large subunit